MLLPTLNKILFHSILLFYTFCDKGSTKAEGSGGTGHCRQEFPAALGVQVIVWHCVYEVTGWDQPGFVLCVWDPPQVSSKPLIYLLMNVVM